MVEGTRAGSEVRAARELLPKLPPEGEVWRCTISPSHKTQATRVASAIQSSMFP